MGEEWIEIAALWKPKNEGSRLICKGSVVEELKKGEKVLVMRNDYATPENRQPQFRLMVIREDGEAHIDLQTGEKIPDEIKEHIDETMIDELKVNPYQMG